MIQRFLSHGFKSYELLKKPCFDIKDVKYEILKNLKIEKLAGSDAIEKIFKKDELETWHAITHISPKLKMAIVGLFSFDDKEKEFYLHILRKPINNEELYEELIGYNLSHFGFKFEEKMKNLDNTKTWKTEERDYLEEELLKAMTKVAETRHIHPHNPHSEFHFKEMLKIKKGNLGIPAIIMAYASSAMVKYGIQIAGKVANFLGVKRKSEFIKTIKRDGFKKYHLHAELQRNFGIRAASLDVYINYMVNRLTNRQPKHQAEIKASLQTMQYLPELYWSINDLNVDVSSSSYDKFFGIMYNKEWATNKYNVMIVNSNSYFKLSDNLDVYKESKSALGGGFSSEKFRIKSVPRQVTEEDITAMRLFNLMIIVKMYDDDLNGKGVDFPNIV